MALRRCRHVHPRQAKFRQEGDGLLARAQTGPLNSRDMNKAYAPRRTDLVP